MGYICDISKWQGTIDFSKLKNQVDFVILRVQAGSTTPDAKYNEYVAGCKQYGINFGTYAYFKGVNIPDAIQEAKDAYARMDKDSKFFALDCEEMTLKNPNDIVPAAQAFIDYMKQKMDKVGLYTGEYFYKHYGMSAIKSSFLWIAKYSNNAPSIPCDLWQNTSTGHIDGVSVNVDLNVLMGSKPLEYFTGNETISNKGVQPFAYATINYPSQYGVNAYDAPNGNYKQKLPGGNTYLVYAEKDGFVGVGQSTWVSLQNVILKRYVVTIDYPSGFGVNAYDSPNGNYKTKIPGGYSYVVYACIDGFFDIGQNTWVDAENCKVKK